VVDEEKMMLGHWFGVCALCSLLWGDAISSMAERTLMAHENMPLISKGLLLKQMQEEN